MLRFVLIKQQLAPPGSLLDNPKVLYTQVEPEQKYKAQSFNDTVVFRGGDAASAWVLNGFRALGLGFGSIVAVTLPAAVAWLGLSLALGRQHAQRAASDGNAGQKPN